ncbi:hypothetical protein D3C75_778690 [compost metagenome]
MRSCRQADCTGGCAIYRIAAISRCYRAGGQIRCRINRFTLVIDRHGLIQPVRAGKDHVPAGNRVAFYCRGNGGRQCNGSARFKGSLRGRYGCCGGNSLANPLVDPCTSHCDKGIADGNNIPESIVSR